MAQRILKNNTASPVPISDTGDTIPASGQLTINPLDYGKYEGSDDVLGPLTDQSQSPTVSTLTANDGTFDLGISEGVRLIQGGFSRPISDGANSTIKANVYLRSDAKYALAVDNLDPANFGTPFYTDNVVSSTPGSIQTLTSFTVAPGKSRFMIKIKISSFLAGTWKAEIGSGIIASGRVSSGHPDSFFEFTPRRELSAGTTFSLKFTGRAGTSPTDVSYHVMSSEI